MSKEPIQPQDKYVLRLPDGMRDRIKRAAEKNNRSMNAEIISRLENAEDQDDLLQAVLSDLEDSVRDRQHNLEVFRWMREQQKALGAIIETIASTDGNLSDDLMKMLRSLVASKGRDTDFPEYPPAESRERSERLEALSRKFGHKGKPDE